MDQSLASPPTGFRLSPQQAHLLRLVPTGPAARCAYALDGELDVARLERALREVLARHEILRTTYPVLPGTEARVQVPGEVPARVLERHDWTGDTAEAQAERTRALLSGAQPAEHEGRGQPGREAAVGEAAMVPGPTDAPAFHLAVLGPRRHLLIARLSALSADRRSLAVLGHELARAYAGELVADPAPQYADVAEVFHQLLEAEDAAEGRQHWRAYPSVDLAPTATAAANLLHAAENAAADHRSPRTNAAADLASAANVAVADATANLVSRTLDAATAAAIHATALRLNATVADFTLACWRLLHARLSGVTATPLTLTLDGRTFEGLGDALGLFSRALPLRNELALDAPFSALLRDTTQAARDAAEWQDYFDPRTGAGSAPGTLAFEALDWPAQQQAAGVTFTATVLESATHRSSLRLTAVRCGDGLRLELDTDAEGTRLLERLEALLRSAAAHPEWPSDALTLLGEDEARQLAALDRTERPFDTDASIHARFEAQVRRAPDATALVFEHDRLTYAQLSERANRLAWLLRAKGVGPETKVGLLLERSTDQLVALLGILKAGGAFVPLDHRHPRERLAHILDQAQARLVVTHSSLSALLPENAAAALCLDAEAATLAKAPTSPPPGETAPDQLAYVLFTSGSTGRPKGVMIAHRSVLNLAATLRERVYQGRGPGLRVSLNAPLAFDASVKQWAQLLNGDALHLIPEDARLDPARMRALVQREALDVLDCTPSLLGPLLAHGLGQAPDFSPALVLVGGEAIDARTWEELSRRPRTRFVNMYGPTECTVNATACPVPDSATPSLGRALGNVRVHLLDRHLRPVPFGAQGELWIGGAGVGRGYADQPALTAARFLPDPSGPPGSRRYRTGDLGRLLPDGRIEFLGRADHQVKLRGFRIELGEIEAVLASHPDVAEAVVLLREAAQGEAQLVAYVVPRQGVGIATPHPLLAPLRALLAKTLPDYMAPRVLVPLDRLPVTRNGKLDRAALPDPGALLGATPYEAPTTPLEQTIAAIWREVLKLDKVGLRHNFFELGGHSLLMVQVHERLATTLGRRFPMVELFQHPTVAELARYLRQATGADAPADTAPDGAIDDRARRQKQALQQQALLTKAKRDKR